jgi:sulfur-oxidizing protein SoxX
MLDPARGNCLICHPAPMAEVEFHGDVGPDLAGVGRRYNNVLAARRIARLIGKRRHGPSAT